ncbi:hypothetical protein CDT99_07225 [Cronobacter sakazakii]|nr:hypothetical protein CDT99_07225 [Cronobacter sakazakii]
MWKKIRMWQTKTRATKKAELVLGQSAKRNQRGVSHDVPPLQMMRMGKNGLHHNECGMPIQ